MPDTHTCADLRDGVRALRAQFPDEHHRRIDAERTLIAAGCIGDGHWFIERVTNCAKQRVVFSRPIGQNQGVHCPSAEAHIRLEAADLMSWDACRR
jgi:acyl-CoA dehydrogenase